MMGREVKRKGKERKRTRTWVMGHKRAFEVIDNQSSPYAQAERLRDRAKYFRPISAHRRRSL
jgi:hypothetical protein